MKTYKLNTLFKMDWSELDQQEHFAMLQLGEQLQRVEFGSKEHGLITIEVLRTLRKRQGLVAGLDLQQAVDCFNAITFFHRTDKGSFRTPWYFFPVFKFRIGRKTFHRPEMIGGLPMYERSFDQLVYADSAYSNFCLLNHQYSITPDKKIQDEMETCINDMIAVLYTRPENFDPASVHEYSGSISKVLSAQQRAMILHTYANVRMFLVARCSNLFPQPPEEVEEVPAAPLQTGPMWMNLRYDLAETEVFKGFETARAALIYDALDYLDKKALEASKNKANAQV
jgi:hypothetical protein